MERPTQPHIERLSAEMRTLLERSTRHARTAPNAESTEPETPAERALGGIWAVVLGHEFVRATDSFVGLGGDSISSLFVVTKAAAAGLRITARQVIESASLRELAAQAQPTQDENSSSDESAFTDEPTRAFPLTPIQQWFFGQDVAYSRRWNQAILVKLRERVDSITLGAAINAVVAHHEVLRSRFLCQGGEWSQLIDPHASVALYTMTITGDSGDEFSRASQLVQQQINLQDGPLIAAVLLDAGTHGHSQLLLAVHHLVVDAFSMRILIDDIDKAYRLLRDGRTVVLPVSTTPFRRWSAELHRLAESDELATQMPYWAAEREPADPFGMRGRPEMSKLQRDCRTISVDLDAETSRKVLIDLPRHGAFSVQALLIAALLLAFRRERGSSALEIDIESHGREETSAAIDLSRTVGWFTAIYPVRFAPADEADPIEVADHVARTLESVPMRGIGYGVLKYLSRHGVELSALPPSIGFNYLGRFDGLSDERAVLGLLVEAPFVLCSEDAARPHIVDVVVTAIDGGLTVQWEHASAIVSSEAADALVAAHAAAIGQLAAMLLALPPGGRRPSQFPLARISAHELSGIRARIAKRQP